MACYPVTGFKIGGSRGPNTLRPMPSITVKSLTEQNIIKSHKSYEWETHPQCFRVWILVLLLPFYEVVLFCFLSQWGGKGKENKAKDLQFTLYEHVIKNSKSAQARVTQWLEHLPTHLKGHGFDS